MIRVMLHDNKTGESHWGGEELLTDWVDRPDLWIWANFDNEDVNHEKDLLGETLALNPLAISDAHRERHPPKIEVFDEYFFMLLNGLDSATSEIEVRTSGIAFFVSHRFLITRCSTSSVSIDSTWAEAEQGKINLARGPTQVTYQVLRRVTDRYTQLVESLQIGLEEIEEEMLEHPRDALLGELIGYGRNLKRLRRIFNYHQDILARLSHKGHPFIEKSLHHEYTDAFEHTERLASLASLYSEQADDLMNGYMSLTSHRLNQIMKVLTVVTVIFLPLTLLVGIYGMNFEYMPDLKIKSAYHILLSIMAGIVITLLLLFRKIRWL
jgi:magnesium transporter